MRNFIAAVIRGSDPAPGEGSASSSKLSAYSLKQANSLRLAISAIACGRSQVRRRCSMRAR
jgi:hypothetical protein